ncbi:MAG: TMEM14 family protein [Jaaginema sp. PMC 1079.18]|nr:TMEM14 family protein [Jaaginema sp. PMC 1080.18]MEC4853781.1 TMEM14 family protein [Jaaginema sp. PMC 1079.18]MEC4868886.1 TMEM14 family protein [Jaaginema sp. PMC 1078.18]
MSAVWATFFYGVLALMGGIWGYIKAKSKPSLISGGISGIILILSGVLQMLGQSWALWVAISLTGILVVTFIIRWLKTRKAMPAAVMIVFGVIAMAVMLTA